MSTPKRQKLGARPLQAVETFARLCAWGSGARGKPRRPRTAPTPARPRARDRRTGPSPASRWPQVGFPGRLQRGALRQRDPLAHGAGAEGTVNESPVSVGRRPSGFTEADPRGQARSFPFVFRAHAQIGSWLERALGLQWYPALGGIAAQAGGERGRSYDAFRPRGSPFPLSAAGMGVSGLDVEETLRVPPSWRRQPSAEACPFRWAVHLRRPPSFAHFLGRE